MPYAVAVVIEIDDSGALPAYRVSVTVSQQTKDIFMFQCCSKKRFP